MSGKHRLLAGLGAVSLAMPALSLALAWATGGARDAASRPEPVAWRTPEPLVAALRRPLFADAGGGDAALPADAPEVVGIAGRLDVDAVALVRGTGGVRAIGPGEGVDGWQLRSLSIDAAYFTRGTQEARVPIGGGDEPAADQ